MMILIRLGSDEISKRALPELLCWLGHECDPVNSPDFIQSLIYDGTDTKNSCHDELMDANSSAKPIQSFGSQAAAKDTFVKAITSHVPVALI